MGHTLPLNVFHKHEYVSGCVDLNPILKAGLASYRDAAALMVLHHYMGV